MATQKGLGKGLGALLGEMNDTPANEAVNRLPLQKIEPNPLQPRKDFDEEELDALAESIRLHGLIQPLSVRKMANGYYQIIAGERRWRAARLAGLTEVPVVILEADEKEAMELALIENLQRSDLNPIEEALGYRELMETYGMTQEQAAQRVGKSRPAVANALRLLSLCPTVLALVRSGKLSAGHARALAAVKDEAQQTALAQKVTALDLSVRQTELLCKNIEKPKKKVSKEPPAVDYLAECEKDLGRYLGRKVKIVSGKKKGRIELEFYSQEDLQQLYDLLSKLRGKGNAQ